MGAHISIGSTSPDWPAVIVGVCAVVAAILVPFLQRKHQIDDERREQAQLRAVMAVALMQPLRVLAERAKMMAQMLGDGTAQAVLPPALVFLRPAEFDQFRPHLHLLGETGQAINRLIGFHADAALASHVYEQSRYDPSHMGRLVNELVILQRLAQQCFDSLRMQYGTGH